MFHLTNFNSFILKLNLWTKNQIQFFYKIYSHLFNCLFQVSTKFTILFMMLIVLLFSRLKINDINKSDFRNKNMIWTKSYEHFHKYSIYSSKIWVNIFFNHYSLVNLIQNWHIITFSKIGFLNKLFIIYISHLDIEGFIS